MDYALLIAFFLIALIYASVGFGGGTSYLALMALWAVPFEVMRPAALVCNIVVVSGGTWIFYREGLLNFRQSWPFLVFSVPLAFVGGYFPIREGAFFNLLGVTLVLASVALWFHDRISTSLEVRNSTPVYQAAALGGAIGFLSGLVSIGGGIFLSPLLHFFRWDHARKISALASVFILVNSIFGLAGQFTRSATLDWDLILPFAAAVFLGGQLGSRWGARRFNAVHIRRVTALLILIAGINILFNH